MSGVNLSVVEDKCMIAYDRTPAVFNGLPAKNFIFEITEHDKDNDIAEFRVIKDGQVIRSQLSKPFPTGALKMKGQELNEASCVVKLKKKQPINLEDFFVES